MTITPWGSGETDGKNAEDAPTELRDFSERLLFRHLTLEAADDKAKYPVIGLYPLAKADQDKFQAEYWIKERMQDYEENHSIVPRFLDAARYEHSGTCR